jgi:hypothetical protein
MAIAYDNSGQTNSASGSGTITISYTVTGSNTFLVIRCYTDSGSDHISGITYAGVTMTEHAKQTLSSGNYVYTYVLLGATTGANDIVITRSGTTAVLSTYSSYTGVLQSGFPDATVSDTGTTTGNITKSITTVLNNCWVISTYCAAEADSPITAGSGNTLRQSLVSGAISAILDSNGPVAPAGNFDSIINKDAAGVRWGRNNFSIAPAGLDAGLVSYWKLDESSGNAVDSIGSVTGTNTGVDFSAGKINNGADFGGGTDKISLGNNFNFSSSFSISLWFQITTTSGELRLITKGDSAGNQYQWGIQMNGSGNVSPALWNGSGAGYLSFVGSSSISLNTWYHYVLTYNSSTTTLTGYLNGSSDGSDNTTNGSWLTSGSANCLLGARADNDSPLTGRLDEVSIFNRALTATEVTELYNSGSGLQYPWEATPETNAAGFLMFI